MLKKIFPSKHIDKKIKKMEEIDKLLDKNEKSNKRKKMVSQNNKNNNVQDFEYENTFWNRFISKKYEVYKLFLFSLVIVLAIGIDKIFAHYLNKYINENILTNTQELIIRTSYPKLIILLLWIFKAI